MDEENHPLTPQQIENIIYSAIDPETTFRKHAAKGLIREFHKRFGDTGLIDLLIAIDNTDRFASMIVLERNEVDNHTYEKWGVFDPDMITKIQLTEAWDDFVHDTIHRSGQAATIAIEQVLAAEN
jgi:hypothetical protein